MKLQPLKTGCPPCFRKLEETLRCLCSAVQGWQMQAYTGYERPRLRGAAQLRDGDPGQVNWEVCKGS